MSSSPALQSASRRLSRRLFPRTICSCRKGRRRGENLHSPPTEPFRKAPRRRELRSHLAEARGRRGHCCERRGRAYRFEKRAFDGRGDKNRLVEESLSILNRGPADFGEAVPPLTKFLKSLHDSICPKLGRSFARHPDVKLRRRFKQAIRVGEPAFCYSICPYHEALAKGLASFDRWTNEIRYGHVPSRHDLIAQPSHASSLLYAIGQRESQIAANIGANGVGVEVDRVEKRGERKGQGRLAGSGKPHDQNLLGVNVHGKAGCSSCIAVL